MHICIDGNEANVKNRVGSNIYAYKVLCELEKLTFNKKKLSVTVLLRDKPLSDMPKARDGWQYQTFGPKKLWTQLALPFHLYFHRYTYDLFFSPGHYAPFVCPIPSVVAVMDTAYLDFPDHFKPQDLFQLKHWTRIAVKNSCKVIAISKATKKSVIKHYHKAPGEVVVAYPGIEKLSKTAVLNKTRSKSILRKFKITEPFILFVGTLQPRKNISTLVESFEIFTRMVAGRTLKKTAKSKSKPPEVKLVLAGKIGWLAEESLDRIANSPLSKSIIQTGFISETEKTNLYHQAVATVLLGRGEGFGLPPLESLACGTPTVVARDSSLPEVVGEIGFQVKQDNPEETAKALYKIYKFTAREKARYRKLAIEHSENFTWSATSEIILKTLTSTVLEIKAKQVLKKPKYRLSSQ